jgi:preprotein translocase subunit SecF
MRLKLVPQNTSWDFFARSKLWIGFSVILIILSLISFFVQSLNFGIDFRGGTSIRTESSVSIDIAAYRNALSSLDLGDITISEVFDPSFKDDQNTSATWSRGGDVSTC